MTDPQSHVAHGMAAAAVCDHARLPRLPRLHSPDPVRRCRKNPALNRIGARVLRGGGATAYADYPAACKTLESAA